MDQSHPTNPIKIIFSSSVHQWFVFYQWLPKKWQIYIKSETRKLIKTFSVEPEIRKFPRFSKFAQNQLHQIELKCVAYGYPSVSINWRKAGEQLDVETYRFNNQGKTKKVGFRNRSKLFSKNISSCLVQDFWHHQNSLRSSIW